MSHLISLNHRYEEYENFIRTFDDRLRKDENIILIMSAIVLFTPNRTKIVHSDVIIMEQVNFQNTLIFCFEPTKRKKFSGEKESAHDEKKILIGKSTME